MEINVADLLKDGYGTLREYDIDEDVRIDGETRRLTGHVRLDRVPDGILVRADLRGGLEAICSRCLKPFTQPLHVAFEEQYVPSVDVHTGAPVVPPEGEEDSYRITARHMIELAEPVEQYWNMAVPMAPLCSPDCPGLCAVCGHDLSDGHLCASAEVDDRWSRLKDLRLG